MIYRNYGQTGKSVSLLGFGGMRFENIDNHDECVQTMLTAAEGGVNYFDTAPGYFETKSEIVFGKAFTEFKRRKLPFYSATKTFESNESKIQKEIEAQLKRLDVSTIDFYHIWCITSLSDWQERKKNKILQTFKRLKDEGLIRHICVSSHLINDEIKELLLEDVFEGVLFGYSAYDFKRREAAFDAIRQRKLGAVVMNPLGGGLIPQNPEKFKFLCRQGENSIDAALRFLWDHQDISVTLVGFQNSNHVKDALATLSTYKPRTTSELAALKTGNHSTLEGICTGCSYCDDCPQGVPIPQFMDTYNQILLNPPEKSDVIENRLKWHWHIDRSAAGLCNACGQCEKACTQHLNIIERLKEIAG